jgi:L-iditol 2-dehydrogenase
VLIKTHQASVCGSERYFYRGITVRPQDEARGDPETVLGEGHVEGHSHAYPMGPLGHEGGGVIVEKGVGVDEYVGGGKVRVDDRVGSLVYPTFTDYWVTDIANIQPIPDGVSFAVGCLYEPLGCAAWAAIHTGVRLGDIVAVNGVGFAGNILLQGAIKSGASKVIAVDVVPAKLEIARQLGAEHVINAKETDPVEAVLELTHGEGVDVAVEAIGGTGIGIVQGLGMLRHNGLLALYGDNYAPVSEFCFHRFHEDGIEVRNLNAVHYTRLRSVENMREAYRAVERGVFDLDVIFENSVSYRMDEIADVFRRETRDIERQASLKTLILP